MSSKCLVRGHIGKSGVITLVMSITIFAAATTSVVVIKIAK